MPPQEAKMVDAKSVGLSHDRLAYIERHLKERYVEPGLIPGAQVLVARKGETVYECVLGLADRDRNVPLASDTIHRIASMTKPITSAALMMLVEEGCVALGDPVQRFIPSWRDLGVFVAGVPGAFQTRPAAPMRVIDLLRHTAGLTYGFPTRTAVDAAYRELGIVNHVKNGSEASQISLDAMIERLATVPLDFAPGEAFNYSVATDVIGYLVGKISGEPFETFLDKRVFQPLGMIDTAFHVPEIKHARLAASYGLGKDGAVVLQDDPRKSPYLEPPHFVSGGGGLVSTAADYMKFCQMLLSGGKALDGARLLGPKTIELMTLNHLPGGRELMEVSRTPFAETGNHGLGFGLGVACIVDVARTELAGSLGSYFWPGGTGVTFWCDPKEELAVVLMTQLAPYDYYPIGRDLRTIVYAAIEAPND
jgi:CubicO group peptidase (beta-lactamase class C family)